MSDEKYNIEEGVSPDVLARVERFKEEDKLLEEHRPSEEANEDNLEETEQEEQSPESVEEEKEEGEQSTDSDKESKIEAFLKDNGLTRDDLLKDHKFEVTIQGRKRAMTYQDIRSSLGRTVSLQKKVSSLENSDELKMGTLALAAKSGDKSAQKKLRDILSSSMKEDETLDDLDDIKGEFNEEDVLSEKLDKQKFDDIFDDVKEDLDFKENMDTINGSLRGRLPEVVWQSYYDSPESRRTMYDLVKSGRMDDLLDRMDQALLNLPHEEQIKVESDPDLFSKHFMVVLKRANAEAAKKTKDNSKDQGEDESDGLDSVSSGKTGRQSGKASKPKVDWMGKSRDDFMKVRAKLIGGHASL